MPFMRLMPSASTSGLPTSSGNWKRAHRNINGDWRNFESRLQEVVTTYRNRLNEPERDLLSMILQHKEEFAQEIKDMAANSMAQIRGAAQQTERRVEKMIEDRLHNLILEAVHEHVRSAPLERDGLSNKQLAAAKGISLRAAKRLRRAGLASPATFRMARSG